jgi:hypothetical protein
MHFNLVAVLGNREVNYIIPSYVMKGNIVHNTTHASMLDVMSRALQVNNHVIITTHIICYYVVTYYNIVGYVELTDYVRLGQTKVMKNVRDRKQLPGGGIRQCTLYINITSDVAEMALHLGIMLCMLCYVFVA